MRASAPYLTVVVPVRNEEHCIYATLEAMARQDYPRDRYEVIVVDGGSTDGTRRRVERFAGDYPDIRVRLLDNPGRFSSRARNIGVRAAKGRLIAVIDGHVHIPNNRLFAAMEEVKERRGALCLARPAPLRMPGCQGGCPFWITVARQSWLGHGWKSHIYDEHEGWCDPFTSGFAYDRSVFERVGYFDEAFDAAEDVEFHYRLNRAGIRAYSSPTLTINSYPRTKFGQLFRQVARYGIGRARLFRKHARAFPKETVVPCAVCLLSLGVIPALAIAQWLPLLTIVCCSMFACYAAVLGTAGVAMAVKTRRAAAVIWVPAVLWIIHFGFGWGFLKTVFLPKRRIFAVSEPCDR